MRESRPYGSVRGALRDERPYREHLGVMALSSDALSMDRYFNQPHFPALHER